MTRTKKLMFLVFMLCALLAANTHDSQALRHYQLDECEAVVPTPNALDWLSGAWESQSRQQVHELQWSKPQGGMLLGFRRSLHRDQMADYEFMRIYQADGTLWLGLKAGQHPEAIFKLIQFTDTSITFEKLVRSSPRRITYQLEPNNTLWVRQESGNTQLSGCQQNIFKRVPTV